MLLYFRNFLIALFWLVIANIFLLVSTLGAAQTSGLPAGAKQVAAASNMIYVQQTPFWVESFTLIFVTVITAVVAPVITMWARKKFAIKKDQI